MDCRLNVGLELNGNSFCDIGAWKGLAPGCWCTGGAMGRLVENTTSEIVNGRPEAEVERGGISIHLLAISREFGKSVDWLLT